MVYVNLQDQTEPTPLSPHGATLIGWVSWETDGQKFAHGKQLKSVFDINTWRGMQKVPG